MCLVIKLDSPQLIQNMRRQVHLIIIETPFQKTVWSHRLEHGFVELVYFVVNGMVAKTGQMGIVASVTESLSTFRIVESQIHQSYFLVNLFCCSVGGPGPLKMDPIHHPPRKITPHRPLR